MRRRILLAAVLFTMVIPGTVAEAGWFHVTNSVFQASEKIQKHPELLSQVLVAPRDLGKATVCVSYNNTLGQKNDGRIITKITFFDQVKKELEEFSSMQLVGGVKNNAYLNCKQGPKVEKGDVVLFEHEFKGMPRVRNNASGRDFVEINGILSQIGEPEVDEAPNGLVLKKGDSPLGLIPSTGAGWFHSSNTIFQADNDNEKQPRKITHTMVVPEEAKKPLVCSAYSNIHPRKKQGRVVTTVTVTRGEEIREELKLAGGVRENEYIGCKSAKKMKPGDVVEFEFELLNMPKLEKGGGKVGYADIRAVISTTGEPEFRQPPPPPPPPPAPPAPEPETTSTPPPPTNTGGGGGGGGNGGGGGGGGNDGGGGGGGGTSTVISQADQRAVSKLLKNNTKTQLWRAKNYSPGKWVAVGPKTKVITGNQLDYKTAGVGGTIVDAAERRRVVGVEQRASLGDDRRRDELVPVGGVGQHLGPIVPGESSCLDMEVDPGRALGFAELDALEDPGGEERQVALGVGWHGPGGVAPEVEAERVDPIGLVPLEVCPSEEPVPELDEALAEAAEVPAVAALGDDRPQAVGHGGADQPLARNQPVVVLGAHDAGNAGGRTGEVPGHLESVRRQGDGGCEHVGEGQLPVTGVELEPAVHTPRHRHAPDVSSEGHGGRTLGAEPGRVGA